MRLLMLSWEYPPNNVGGLGKHVTELVPALAEQGVEVHLITPRLKGGEFFTQEASNIFIYRVEPPMMDLGDFFSFAWQTNLKLQETAYHLIDEQLSLGKSFDLVHAHDWLVAFTGGAIKQHYKIPLVATIHATERGRCRGYLGSDMSRSINNVEWWLTYEAWQVICCSQYMIREVSEYFETPLDKIEMVPNGVIVSKFDELRKLDLTDFRNNFAAPDQKIIFHVGRMVDEKGVRLLVETAPLILSSYPRAKFVIAGTGPQLNEYRGMAARMGLELNFYFTGFISDEVRDKLYSVADVAVFPSLYEPFGIVALEAMAARTPVVVAESGGLSEVVMNHETGIKVVPNSHGSLAWGILHTLNNPDWSSARVENAYRVVKEHYNWQHVARLTIRVYEHVKYAFLSSDWGLERSVLLPALQHTEEKAVADHITVH